MARDICNRILRYRHLIASSVCMGLGSPTRAASTPARDLPAGKSCESVLTERSGSEHMSAAVRVSLRLKAHRVSLWICDPYPGPVVPACLPCFMHQSSLMVQLTEDLPSTQHCHSRTYDCTIVGSWATALPGPISNKCQQLSTAGDLLLTQRRRNGSHSRSVAA